MQYERMSEWKVHDKRVLDAVARVPRHFFVDTPDVFEAYEDRPLPIGHGQTISQPYIVALMTELLAVEPHHRVLEIGTGSGFQAAVLAQLAGEVISVEIIEALAKRARERLAAQGCQNVEVHHGDGYKGYPPKAPYDRIIVTASCPDGVPEPLEEQLKPSGRLVLPTGATSEDQQLVAVIKDMDGKLQREEVLPVRFVPLTRRLR